MSPSGSVARQVTSVAADVAISFGAITELMVGSWLGGGDGGGGGGDAGEPQALLKNSAQATSRNAHWRERHHREVFI